MKTRIILLLTFLLLTLPFAGGVQAEKRWRAEDIEMVHLKDARRYVCNPEGIIDAATVAAADSVLAALERDKGVQTVVVVVEHLDPDDPYTFGMNLGRLHGIGSKQSNTGLIVVLATKDRSYTILTGTGLEGTLPDAICRRIQNRVMVPLLKKREWSRAIFETLKSLGGYIRGDGTIKADIEEDDDWGALAGLSVAAIFVLFTVIVIIQADKKQRRDCPQCGGKKTMHVTGTKAILKNRRPYARKTLTCQTCGHTITQDDPIDNSGAGGGAVPPIIPIGGFGGGRGGGFSGGSFGGGLFGGGGSSGRF